MSGWVVEASKDADESRLLTVSFANELAVGEAIIGAQVTATVYAGTDASPQDIVDGSASYSGANVSQLISGGVEGVQYILAFEVTTDQSQNLIKRAYLTVL